MMLDKHHGATFCFEIVSEKLTMFLVDIIIFVYTWQICSDNLYKFIQKVGPYTNEYLGF